MLFLILFFGSITKFGYGYDENGYVVYCPCMGRFGNQADHFLGSLAFSKGLNRTLVLPPWIEYKFGESKSTQVPFDTYFKVSSLENYHSVITMEKFMINVAPTIWLPSDRISFCYMERKGDELKSCNAKNGNPFGPFWDNFDIDFKNSEFYAPLNYDTNNVAMSAKWKAKYPSRNWPVLAFTGAPASFPVQNENRFLHKYLEWNDNILKSAQTFIKKYMTGGAFIGIHLRNGQDWYKACQHVKDSPTLFSAPQCVGYKNERGPLTQSMCYPTKDEIIKQLKKILKKHDHVKYIFVASDANHMIEDLTDALKFFEAKVVKSESPSPHVDLAILGLANYFIGNCVSSFTAFVKRERDTKGLPSEFWSYPHKRKAKHEEL